MYTHSNGYLQLIIIDDNDLCIRLHLQVNNQRKDIPIVVIKHYCI